MRWNVIIGLKEQTIVRLATIRQGWASFMHEFIEEMNHDRYNERVVFQEMQVFAAIFMRPQISSRVAEEHCHV